MIIRPMCLNDINTVIEIENSLYKIPWGEKQFVYELTENEFSYSFVLEEEERIIGYYIFLKLFETSEILKISIAREVQGFGLANIIMEDCFKRIKVLKCESIFLEVRESNLRALNLYNKHGFVKIGTRSNYYTDGENASILEKKMGEETNE